MPRFVSCASALLIPVLTGCVSVDPTADVATAAGSASVLIGQTPDFDSPWDATPTWDGSLPLSCENALTIALSRNRELRLAVTDIALARSELAAADTPPNPMVDLGIGFPLEAMGTSITAAAMQQLAWLWQRPSRIEAGEANLRAAVLDAADRAVEVASRIKTEFAAVVAAEEVARSRERALEATKTALTALDAAVAEGAASDFERRAASDAMAMAERDRQMARERLVRSRAALLESLALADTRAEWSTDGVWPSAALMDIDPVDAARRRLDVAAADARVLATEASLETAMTARFGGIAVGAMYERMSDGEQLLGPALSVEVPILDRGDPRIAAANASLEKARLEADAKRQTAITECRVAAEAAAIALRQHQEGSERRRIIAEATTRQVAAQVEAGTTPRIDFAMSVMTLATREVEAIEDRLAAVSAAIELSRSVGVHAGATLEPALVDSADRALASRGGRR